MKKKLRKWCIEKAMEASKIDGMGILASNTHLLISYADNIYNYVEKGIIPTKDKKTEGKKE